MVILMLLDLGMCALLEVMVQVRDVGQRWFVIQGKIQVGEVIDIDMKGGGGKVINVILTLKKKGWRDL